MKLWSAFYPDLVPELSGAALPIIDHWLRNTAIDFFDRSKAYVVDLAAIDAVASQMGYTLTLPANTDLVEIKSIFFSGKPLDPKARQFLESRFPDWRSEVGAPDYYTQQDLNNVLLVPAPSANATGAIKIQAAIKPSIAAIGIEDWLFAKWRQALCSGTKAKMMAMRDVPWASPDHVAINLSAYEDAVMKATGNASNGFGMARPRFSGSFC